MIALYLRYTIDPNKLSGFAQYAAAEQIPIRESRGAILSYFQKQNAAKLESTGALLSIQRSLIRRVQPKEASRS